MRYNRNTRTLSNETSPEVRTDLVCVDELYAFPLDKLPQRQEFVDVKRAPTIQHVVRDIVFFEHLFKYPTPPCRAHDRLEAPRASQVDGDGNGDVFRTFRMEGVDQNNNTGWHGTPVYQNHRTAGQGKKRRGTWCAPSGSGSIPVSIHVRYFLISLRSSLSSLRSSSISLPNSRWPSCNSTRL